MKISYFMPKITSTLKYRINISIFAIFLMLNNLNNVSSVLIQKPSGKKHN